ncbi:MAG TPA: cohesin domain-containing protein [bacterium]|mgnify:CR=1 FL=1|nr:cohesin domain-containing protein [bacterium]
MTEEPMLINNNYQPKKWWWILIVILIVLIIAFGIWLFLKDKNKEETENILEQKNSQITEESEGVTKKISTRPARLSFKTKSPAVTSGQELNVEVLLDTQKSNIVVASAYVAYDPNFLQLKNLDVNNSVLTMGIRAQKNTGLVEIIRGIPGNANPDDTNNGYTGTDGVLATLTFKALKSGQSVISFQPEKSRLILDDGLGSEMTTALKNLSLNIIDQ